jgi:hypothetical protein
MKVRYHRTGTAADVRDYAVETQARPRGRWTKAGMVSRFGRDAWAALGADATAWTSYRASRGEAVRDMLAGRTFWDDQPRTAATA